MNTDTALQAADAVFMAEQAVGKARAVVDESAHHDQLRDPGAR
ncbi:hypothetical protein [Nocardioides convexus]|nr:hypothetical protein [Nocardioides convexus]